MLQQNGQTEVARVVDRSRVLSDAEQGRPMAVITLSGRQKKPRNRMRYGAKNWLVAANQRSSVKTGSKPLSDAVLRGAFET